MKSFTYDEACRFMREASRSGIVPGLDSISRLCAELGDPQDKLRTIHIAGTNGKGSVGAYLASVLMRAGCRVGRFVSPAAPDMRDAFSVNGISVSENEYASAVSLAADAAKRVAAAGFPMPTQFELETAAAFLCLASAKCDISLIEAGMGGRLDATNVIKKPLLSVITHIAPDHTAFLGNTLYEITREKAGIIKPGCPVLTTDDNSEILSAVSERCAEVGSAHYRMNGAVNVTDVSASGICFEYSGMRLHTRMRGLYQARNAAQAVHSALILREGGLDITDEAIINGIDDAYWGGRFEFLRQEPPFVIDGAHNPDGAAALAESVRAVFGNRNKPCFVFGMFRDKDYERTAALTAGLASRIYTITAPSPRGLDAVLLADTLKKYHHVVLPCQSLRQAVSLAASCPDGAVCFGSLSFLDDVKNIFAEISAERDGDA